MRYQGSKKKMVKVLKTLIEKNLSFGDLYYEPFGGGMNVISEIEWKYKVANDKNPYIIALWKDIQAGKFCPSLWDFVENLTKEQYYNIKNLWENNDSFRWKFAGLIGYVATACSYGGGWWAGYANYNPKKDENHILEAYNGIQKQIKDFKYLSFPYTYFKYGDYDEKIGYDYDKTHKLIYCDPPYANTRKYKDSFDSESFWEWAKEQVVKGNKVIVSEYNAPAGWICIWSKEMQDGMNSDSTSRKIEKIFIHESQKKIIKI